LKILISLFRLISPRQRSIMKSPLFPGKGALHPADDFCYDRYPPRVLLEVNALFAEMQRILPYISAPTLLIDGEADKDIGKTASTQILEHLSAKRTKVVKIKSNLSEDTLPVEQERISTAIIQFVASLSGPKL
jgi:esterase/lipase